MASIDRNSVTEESVTFLLVTGSEAFRNRETASWGNLRDILSDVRGSGSEVMSELNADVTNSCMDLMDITGR